MEASILFVIALATVLVSRLLHLIASSRVHSKVKKQPPGPWTVPIIGSLHHILGGLPHRAMLELSRRHGPLMFLRLGEVPTVVVSSAEAAELVMKTNDILFTNRARSGTLDIFGSGGKGLALAPYGEHWRQMRKVCITALLSTKQVKRLEGIRAQEVGNLVHSITTSGREGAFNLSEELSALGNNIASRALFSDRCARQDEYLRHVDEVVKVLGIFWPADIFPSSRLVRWFCNGERNMKKSCGRIHRIISDIIEDRRVSRAACDVTSAKNEDMLEVLLKLQEEDSLSIPLTTQIIGAVLFDLFLGGTDTSATVLGWAMSELFNNPNVMARVQFEVRELLGPQQSVIMGADLHKLHFMQMVIKEVLRIHPPLPLLLPREAREDCEVMGYHIPKGTNIYVNTFALSRDPRYWESPEEFKPERFENNNMDYFGTHFEFIPFGAGRRQCAGIQFGASTVEIGLANLLYHFDWVHPNGKDTHKIDMSEKYGMTLRRKFDLELIAIPHVPSITRQDNHGEYI